MDTLFLNEQRCACGKLLLKGVFFDGTLEVKCKNCGAINKIGSIKLADDELHYLLIINNKGIITNVSNSACTILGYTHEEIIGKYFSEICPLLSAESIDRFFGPNTILTENNYFQLDTTNQTKDGKIITVTALLKSYQPVEGERQVLLSAEIKDLVSEKKVSDKNEVDFLNNVCDFYFDIDKSGVVEYISQNSKKFIGLTQSDFVGHKYLDFISLENRDDSHKLFESFSVNGQPYKITDKKFIDKDGKNIEAELYFAPKYNELGKFVGYCVLVWLKK